MSCPESPDLIVTNVIAVILGILASYIASIVFSRRSYNNKPTIKVSDVLIKTSGKFKAGMVKGFIVKAVNLTKNDLLDIKIDLYGVKKDNDKGTMTSSFLLSSKEVHFWEKYDPNDKTAQYAWHIHLPINHDVYHDYKTIFVDFDYLYLNITARDSLHHSFAVVPMAYSSENIKDSNCHFMDKESLDYACNETANKNFEDSELQKKAPMNCPLTAHTSTHKAP